MEINSRLSDKEYENLSVEYEQDTPKLSGNPGFLTTVHERTLISKLLPPDYARIINMKAQAMSISPSAVIKYIIKEQLIGNA